VAIYTAQNTARSSATAEGPRDEKAISVEILPTAAQLYEKSHLEWLAVE